MRCSKSYYLCDLELVDLFDNKVIEQVDCSGTSPQVSPAELAEEAFACAGKWRL